MADSLLSQQLTATRTTSRPNGWSNNEAAVEVLLSRVCGLNGGMYVGDTLIHTLSFFAIQVLTNTVISAYEGNLIALLGVTLPAGTIIYGTFSTITLASGSVILYK